MKASYLIIISVLIFNLNAVAQSGTFAKVYSTFQTSCSYVYCHSNITQAGNLNLEGAGFTDADRMNDVYNNLYNKSPKNTYASRKGYKLVSPGDPYASFLFRKAHGNLKGDDLVLHPDEGDAMPQHGIALENKEAEIIRQWILYGAPKDGEVVDTSLIGRFYREGGIVSANEPPKAPEEGKGFQIHLGPFFLAPKAEIEFFSKYDTRLKTNIEVKEIDAYMGKGYSHHFILFRYKDSDKNLQPWGLRKDNAHMNTEMVSAHQQSEAIPLPPGTAFPWNAGSYLDLNTHYINYSTTKVLAAEVYVNVYTQPAGTAKQVMYSSLIANTSIFIPNDKKEHTFTDYFLAENSYLWAITSHTHKYGKDYDVYFAEKDGKLGEQIFEGSCKNGIPGCMSTNYDYQHPPVRKFSPFLPIKSQTGNRRIAHVAKYVNNGAKPVTFGATSDDEMMVLLAMYVKDTTGLGEAALGSGKLPSGAHLQLSANVFPNPFSQTTNIAFRSTKPGKFTLVITDAAGRTIYTEAGTSTAGVNQLTVTLADLPKGLYIYNLLLGNGAKATGKISKL